MGAVQKAADKVPLFPRSLIVILSVLSWVTQCRNGKLGRFVELSAISGRWKTIVAPPTCCESSATSRCEPRRFSK